MRNLTRVFCFAIVIPASAFAQTTTYTFDPGSLTYATASGTYTTSMTVSGWFQTASPLAANLTGADVSAALTAYSFSDGVQTLSESNSYVRNVVLSTDGSGAPTDWALTFYRNNGGNVAGCDVAYIPGNSLQIDGFTDAVCASGTPDNCDLIFDFGPNNGMLLEAPPVSSPGAWTVAAQAPTAIPTLSTRGAVIMVILLAGAALLALRRFKA